MNIREIQQALAAFASDRDWDQFHSPKNLCMAMCGEVGELTEHFQWLSEEQSFKLASAKKGEVAHELADIVIYAMRLGDRLGIDLESAIGEKMRINAEKYPISTSKGNATKYTDRDK